MAKHPVPKKKTSKSRSSQRHSKFLQKTRKALTDLVHLTKCPDCGAKKLMHHVCKECGKYKGRQAIDINKKIEKITKIKA
jgi:large subunit ribosomal protein L32